MHKEACEILPRNGGYELQLKGVWQRGSSPTGADLLALLPQPATELTLDTQQLAQWDSSLPTALYPLIRHCHAQQIAVDLSRLPASLQALLSLATGVSAEQARPESRLNWRQRWIEMTIKAGQAIQSQQIFIGESARAAIRWLMGKSKTRSCDIAFFVRQAGPEGLGIIALIALLVGMILAYLGAIQLRQWGAQVYVANLVALGMVREMGALMTAVIMAGRTGAAYAAQLGTMQVNEEIDALKVMGVNSMEFLVLPRMLALVAVMPLLCLYADMIGILGGAIVAAGMDVSFLQYLQQTQGAVDWLDIFAGLIKSVVFGLLIAQAGCQAGIECGRNSDAVGRATTQAVVTAIIYLVVADAAINIVYDKLGI